MDAFSEAASIVAVALRLSVCVVAAKHWFEPKKTRLRKHAAVRYVFLNFIIVLRVVKI
jgi:hypothetical protein